MFKRFGFARKVSASEPGQAATAPLPVPKVLRTVPAEEARQAHQHNPHAVWAGLTYQANETDASLASKRIWAKLPDISVRPKFLIDPTQPVFAVGSCFAREVEDALAALGFDVPTYCDALFDAPALLTKNQPAGMRPRSFLNRYNSMSMLEEFRHLLGVAPEIEAGLLTYASGSSQLADLHYSQSVNQAAKSVVLERRKLVREHLGSALRRSRLFVLTLGMAECWYDKDADRYLNNTPGPRVLASSGKRLEVRLTTFNAHLQALEAIHQLLSSELGADFKVVITVSPVPLQRTYLEQDIVVTNSYAKSMLRAVAQEFASAHANVDYFPSYELVNYSDPKGSWAWDYRHVKPDLVAHIMGLFRRHYAPDAASPGPAVRAIAAGAGQD